MSRRAIVQALIALPALSLLRSQPAVVDPDETVEINGWILRRSDLACRAHRRLFRNPNAGRDGTGAFSRA